jgi:CHAD domain-containing protein
MKTSQVLNSRFILPDNINKKVLLEMLSQHFTVKTGQSINEDIAIIESFNWGLYQHNMLAVRQEDNSISLYTDDSTFLDPELALKIDGIGTRSRFWWDFPEGEARDILKGILDLRALYPVFQGKLKIEEVNLQDDEGKTLVFGQMISIFSPERPATPILREIKISSLTGYDDEYLQAVSILEQLRAFIPTKTPLDTFYGAIGVAPTPYTVKPKLNLDPQATTRTSVSSIIKTMIEKQRQTEQGIIKDIDTEYLHHYRVALRMIRAAIAQLKEVFPEQEQLKLKERFGALARDTNQLRDLDVFILDKERYMNLLPPALRDGLLPMYKDFEQSRSAEVKRVARRLSSKAYQNEIESLQSLFINGYSALETAWSEKPTIELAVEKIQKRYRKIQKAASKITQDTPDEAIHSIRIECKKLRYLLYFFGDLFNKKQVKIAGNHLKSLQDTLGIFNDLSVQCDFLQQYLYDTEHKAKKDVLLIASLGGLITSLYTLQKQERENCIRELAVFSNKENRQLFNETFII